MASAGSTLFVIPDGTTIPARGHFLGVNTAGYSLINYGGAGAAAGNASFLTTLGVDQGVALFDTTAYTGLSTPLDSVGFVGNGSQYFEGVAIPAAAITPGVGADHSFMRRYFTGAGTGLQDSGSSLADWALVATDPGADPSLTAAVLGGPSPENLAAEREQTNAQLQLGLCNPLQGDFVGDNYLFTPGGAENKSIELRRTFTNLTAASITSLRFKVTSLTTLNSNGGGTQADYRATTSVARPATACVANGLTLEAPPGYAQLLGAGSGTMGGLNSSLRTTAVPLGAGNPVGVNFKLYYTTSGLPGFYWVTAEAKP